MRLDWLRPLTEQKGPFASVTLDVSNVDPATRDQRLKSWERARRDLADQGAGEDTLAALDSVFTGEASGAGERTRVVCAAGDRVVLDIGLPGRPRQEEAAFGPTPRVMSVVRALAGSVAHAVVRLDREGADIEVFDPTGDVLLEKEVEGDHNELRKVSAGGWSQRRYESRAEDSWKANATQVVKELDRLVRRLGLSAVLVSGEDHMVSHLQEQASGAVSELIIRLDTGGRAEGISEEAAATAREAALARLHADSDAELAERWGDATGSGLAVEGWTPISEALEKAQVAHVLVQADGPALESSGAEVGTDLDTLLMTLAEQSAEVSVVGPPFEAKDGIGALLRWTDDSTTH